MQWKGDTELDVPSRLQAFARLSDGWLNAEGLALSADGLAWFSSSFANRWPVSIPLPYVYPTLAGGVHLEWSFPTASACAEVDLTRRTAGLTVSRTTDGELLEEGDIDLVSPGGWIALAEAIGRYGRPGNALN